MTGNRAGDERNYRGEGPGQALQGLTAASVSLNRLLGDLDPAGWARCGVGSDGAERSVLDLARRAAHELVHHEVDIERGAAHLPGPTPTGIELAICDDAAPLARVHHATVQAAYTGFFPAGSPPPKLDDLVHEWGARLVDPTAVAIVAIGPEGPIGTVLVRQDPDIDGEAQLVGLHVMPGRQGQGTGGALHDVATRLLAASGWRTVGLWVIAANRRARDFYERRGWVERSGIELHYQGVVEVRYALDLNSEAR